MTWELLKDINYETTTSLVQFFIIIIKPTFEIIDSRGASWQIILVDCLLYYVHNNAAYQFNPFI